MKPVDWVLFDVDDTLISSNLYMSLYTPIVTKLVGEKGVPFLKLNKEMERIKSASGSSRADTYDLCETFNALDLYYQELSAHIAGSAVRTEVQKLFEGLHEMGKNIGIVSNSHSRTVKLLLEHHGLTEHIDFIFCREHGGEKNSLPFWQALMTKHNLDPQKTLVVDNEKKNLDNASVLGFRTHQVQGLVDFNLIRYIT